ncbi:hypothetical protein ELH42_29845 (plasmid) [Rhizobium ruizarguesonis]|uniref:hypothetical protein n=1 Tax=Rhizobium ruizarguesonis TaxID=2081791 RepID=UPI001031B511|nr:hypothetical protein [Rhizobium ruizarguesonis]TBB60042.1 hypothetical protein ELH42_29845 [Rhizobium ruizarguesonis]
MKKPTTQKRTEKTPGRSAKTGKFEFTGKLVEPVVTVHVSEKRPRKSNKHPARPVNDRADAKQFAADLLISNKIIMDYLAK